MREIWKNILLLVIVVILFLIFFEVFLRLFLPQNACIGDFDEPLRVFKFAPNSECIWNGYTNEFKVPIKFNNKGYRDYSYSLNHPLGITRIAVVGDSYVAALQVPFDNMFTKKLERKLNQNKKKYEVMGFGISGMGTEQEKILLEKEILKYNPNIVILAFTVGNDIRDNILYDLENIDISKKIKFRILFSPIKNFLRANFHTFSFFVDTFRLIKNKLGDFIFLSTVKNEKNIYDYDYEIYFENYSIDVQNGWKETKDALLKMDSLTSELMIFIIPTPFQVDSVKYNEFIKKFEGQKTNITKPIDIIIDFGNENDIMVINPLEEFHDRNVNNSFYWQYDGHWNEKGHSLAAEVIFDFLVTNKLATI